MEDPFLASIHNYANMEVTAEHTSLADMVFNIVGAVINNSLQEHKIAKGFKQATVAQLTVWLQACPHVYILFVSSVWSVFFPYHVLPLTLHNYVFFDSMRMSMCGLHNGFKERTIAPMDLIVGVHMFTAIFHMLDMSTDVLAPRIMWLSVDLGRTSVYLAFHHNPHFPTAANGVRALCNDVMAVLPNYRNEILALACGPQLGLVILPRSNEVAPWRSAELYDLSSDSSAQPIMPIAHLRIFAPSTHKEEVDVFSYTTHPSGRSGARRDWWSPDIILLEE
ncbi:hypothetical protein FISHEDRAFT_69709 [Fistulina hepatica ATCC 64428]|uniref:Uncharacterized protein n=1 Tax=Fistulina hepatica ATCC 64428 TaxID=1128425 RepID=A0A0D7APA8_9AGAR|nr:hypothetical protein FISHEDRAFT_69709 [Fistulina hepatica ATCC 64428]